MPEGAAVDRQLTLDAIAFRAEQLEIFQLRQTAFGDGDHMIQHQVFPRPAVGAARAALRRKPPSPLTVTPLQRPPFPPLDLGRRPPFGRGLAQLRGILPSAARQKTADAAIRRPTSATMIQSPAIAAVPGHGA